MPTLFFMTFTRESFKETCAEILLDEDNPRIISCCPAPHIAVASTPILLIDGGEVQCIRDSTTGGPLPPAWLHRARSRTTCWLLPIVHVLCVRAGTTGRPMSLAWIGTVQLDINLIRLFSPWTS
jgi:hypothetical protein